MSDGERVAVFLGLLLALGLGIALGIAMEQQYLKNLGCVLGVQVRP